MQNKDRRKEICCGKEKKRERKDEKEMRGEKQKRKQRILSMTK